jgi:hypothetical protein
VFWEWIKMTLTFLHDLLYSANGLLTASPVFLGAMLQFADILQFRDVGFSASILALCVISRNCA